MAGPALTEAQIRAFTDEFKCRFIDNLVAASFCQDITIGEARTIASGSALTAVQILRKFERDE